MKKLFYIFLILALPAQGQNYVMNGSIEEIDSCPSFKNGSTITTGAKYTHCYRNSPDIVNECSIPKYISFQTLVGIPHNYGGYQWARTGRGMAIYFYSGLIPDTNKLGGEIFSFDLREPLDSGKKYCLRFFHVLSDSVPYATDLLEGVLSNEYSMIIMNHCNYFSLVSNSNHGAINDTLNWKSVQGIITANGKERYVHIGRFHLMDNNHLFKTNAPPTPVYKHFIIYYLDDIALWPCDTIPPVADAGPDITICRGDSALIGGHNYDDYYYSWWHDSICYQNGPSEIYRDDSLGQIYVKPDKSTLYIVQATDFKYDKTLDSVWVYVKDCSPAHYDTTICLGDGVRLGNNRFTYESYLWSPDLWLDNNHSANPLAKPNDDITYTVAATDTNGFVHHDTVQIKVKICHLPPEIEIPNVITPNGDGINDVFRFKNEEFWHLKIQIFNRWGQPVFSGKEGEHWNGTYQGKQVSEGVYFYHITAKAEGFEKVFEYGGTVTVWR